MNKTRLWIFLAVLAATTFACTVLGGAPTSTPVPRDKVATPVETATSRPSYNTEFPLPDDISNFFELGGGAIINFETKMSLEETMAFYRDSFGKQGYKERETLTVSSDSDFSMVFDGHQSGQAIYVKGVEASDSSTNVSIHLGAKE